MAPRYRGRFAPSPNGPLHFGSLIAATASFLDARCHGGEWWLRIDDLDTPRVVPGAADHIIATLEAFGFEWNGLVFQSRREEHYQEAFERLPAYPCGCNRREVFTRDPSGAYHGHCRIFGPPNRAKPPAWRVQPARRLDHFDDLIQGPQHCDCRRWPGEIVVRRADGFWSYHLACAVDEIEMGITHVIRGADLLTATFGQRMVMHLLKAEPPRYGHHPVAVNEEGIKLSKRARATPIDARDGSTLLWQALNFLGQRPPAELRSASLPELWSWAHQHYNRASIPARPQQRHDAGTD